MIAELFQDAVTLSETAVLTFRQAYRGVPNMVGKMMDQRVRDLTDRIYSIGPDRGPYCFRLSEYNLLAQNREVFAQMLEEAPGLLRFYCLYLAPERASPADQPGEKARGNLVFDHPWEVTELVKERLGLSPAEWRYFTRLWTGPQSPSERGVQRAETLVPAVRLWTRF